MGFNKYYVPEPQDFIEHLERGGGPSHFVAIKKIDAVIGSDLSVKMLDRVYEMVRNGSKDSEVLKELKAMLK